MSSRYDKYFKDIKYEFKKEYKFHPIRRWRMDYAIPKYKVAIEIHGSTFAGGRHTRGLGFKNDREKMNAAQLLGWIVLEYPNFVLKTGVLKDDIKAAVELQESRS